MLREAQWLILILIVATLGVAFIAFDPTRGDPTALVAGAGLAVLAMVLVEVWGYAAPPNGWPPTVSPRVADRVESRLEVLRSRGWAAVPFALAGVSIAGAVAAGGGTWTLVLSALGAFLAVAALAWVAIAMSYETMDHVGVA